MRDHGPGIPAADRLRLLEAFERGDNARPDGTGLGLSIVAACAAAHAGSVHITDAPGGGVQVELQFSKSASSSHAREPERSTGGASHDLG